MAQKLRFLNIFANLYYKIIFIFLKNEKIIFMGFKFLLLMPDHEFSQLCNMCFYFFILKGKDLNNILRILYYIQYIENISQIKNVSL